jgi:hypothetical protein
VALARGERYRCADAECGCLIEVVKGSAPRPGYEQDPRCFCGREMTEAEAAEAVLEDVAAV